MMLTRQPPCPCAGCAQFRRARPRGPASLGHAGNALLPGAHWWRRCARIEFLSAVALPDRCEKGGGKNGAGF